MNALCSFLPYTWYARLHDAAINNASRESFA
jgi:hypothetical protein